MRFDIEHVFTTKTKRPKPIVLARLLDVRSDFYLTDDSRLGDIEITKNFTIPRIIDKEGNPRLDIFAFEIKYRNDIDKFQKGQIVELESGDNLVL